MTANRSMGTKHGYSAVDKISEFSKVINNFNSDTLLCIKENSFILFRLRVLY